MIKIDQKENCCGCQACAQICPKNCISMEADEEGFLYPVVDASVCVNCGLCEKICPVLHGSKIEGEAPKAYAAYNRDEEVRLTSSSGGIFSLLAEYVLRNNGVIYGAAMDGRVVKHIRVADMDGLALLRGSKYVQSNIGQTYAQAKKDLKSKIPVLFTGTPCQIEGLRSFLGKDYENLISMDIICHGVPSPMVWEKYVQTREQAAGAPAARMFFRHKKYGWKTYAVLFEFANKTAYVRRINDDPFMQAFLHDLCLRPSCYQCRFKKENRVSDITVADFWGIENVCPEMDDDKGTSLVIVHSEKGNSIFNAIEYQMFTQQVDFNVAVKGNPAMHQSAKKPKSRAVFTQKIQVEPFEAVVRKYAKNRITVKSICKKILHRMGLLDFVKKIRGK